MANGSQSRADAGRHPLELQGLHGGEVECLDLGMWSRDENVGQSDTGKASMAVDKRYSHGSGREKNKASLKHSCSALEMWRTVDVRGLCHKTFLVLRFERSS